MYSPLPSSPRPAPSPSSLGLARLSSPLPSTATCPGSGSTPIADPPPPMPSAEPHTSTFHSASPLKSKVTAGSPLSPEPSEEAHRLHPRQPELGQVARLHPRLLQLLLPAPQLQLDLHKLLPLLLLLPLDPLDLALQPDQSACHRKKLCSPAGSTLSTYSQKLPCRLMLLRVGPSPSLSKTNFTSDPDNIASAEIIFVS
uniref:Uncharacterized protein n=1 Tax=Rhizoctonia solani positive-strand RNA virus 1 TaxID=1807789 RepID=A0A127AXH8_9VIRU|nr:hypothetical protein [Rhizoctonia solani positive-strand RNA virus 1]